MEVQRNRRAPFSLPPVAVNSAQDIDRYLAAGAARLVELDREIAMSVGETRPRLPLPMLQPVAPAAPRPVSTKSRNTGGWKERHRIYVLETGNLCPQSLGCTICADLSGGTE